MASTRPQAEGTSEQNQEWLCAVCGNINFHYRDTCHGAACRAVKGFPGPFRESPTSLKQPPSAPWTCPQCGNYNRSSRIKCHRNGCAVERHLLPGTEGKKPDDFVFHLPGSAAARITIQDPAIKFNGAPMAPRPQGIKVEAKSLPLGARSILPAPGVSPFPNMLSTQNFAQQQQFPGMKPTTLQQPQPIFLTSAMPQPMHQFAPMMPPPPAGGNIVYVLPPQQHQQQGNSWQQQQPMVNQNSSYVTFRPPM